MARGSDFEVTPLLGHVINSPIQPQKIDGHVYA